MSKGKTLYELVTSKEHQEKTKGMVEAMNIRHKNFVKIKKFAIEQRGWPEKEATMLAGQMTGGLRTQFPD